MFRACYTSRLQVCAALLISSAGLAQQTLPASSHSTRHGIYYHSSQCWAIFALSSFQILPTIILQSLHIPRNLVRNYERGNCLLRPSQTVKAVTTDPAAMAALVPLSYFSASVFCSLTALNVSQPYRPALLVSLIASGLLAFRRLTDVSSSPEAASVLGLFVLIYLSHMSSVLCLEKYRLPKESTDWDWKMAYKMLFNARWLGTERQAPDIRPGFDSAAISINKNDSQFLSEKEALTKQSRRRTYLFKRLFSALTIYALYHLYTQIFHTYQLLEYTDFLPSKQTYLRRLSTVTARETFIRTGLVFHFTWSAWAIFTGIHDVLALISVGVGLDDPENWPPLYGSPYQMYSLRRFWGKFWHRLVYRTYTGYGALISQKLFGFRRGSLLDKLLVNFSVFLFSGVIHALVTFQLGFQCGYWEDVMWFSLNFVAVVVEQASQAALLILFGRYARNQALGKAVGSAWVFAFFFWSLPKLEYSKVYCGTA